MRAIQRHPELAIILIDLDRVGDAEKALVGGNQHQFEGGERTAAGAGRRVAVEDHLQGASLAELLSGEFDRLLRTIAQRGSW